MDEVAARAQGWVGGSMDGKWRLDQLLGFGGMASVYAASHRNGARAALKLLHPELSLDEEARGRFLREGYLANAVGHPGVVRALDDGVSAEGLTYLVLELLDGEPLDAYFARGGDRVADAEALWIADRTLDALAAAHAVSIVHRDLKPPNLYLTRDGGVKLLDFGIAQASQVKVTLDGRPMGTPGFMAPEQAQGRAAEVDGRSDLWAVGATLFTLMTGRVIHAEKTPNLSLMAAMTKHAPPIATFRPDLPAAVREVVDRALAFDAGDRWQDARAMQAAVRHAAEEVGGQRAPSPRSSLAPTEGMPAPPERATPATPRVTPIPRTGFSRRTYALASGAALAAASVVVALGVLAAGRAGIAPGSSPKRAPIAAVAPAQATAPSMVPTAQPAPGPLAGRNGLVVAARGPLPPPPPAPQVDRAAVEHKEPKHAGSRARVPVRTAATPRAPEIYDPRPVADPLDRRGSDPLDRRR